MSAKSEHPKGMTKVSSDDRLVSIPKSVRDDTDVSHGDDVFWYVEDDGTIVARIIPEE